MTKRYQIYIEQRHLVKERNSSGTIFQAVEVSFIPIRGRGYTRATVFGDTPEEAFSSAKALFPAIRGLAVGESR